MSKTSDATIKKPKKSLWQLTVVGLVILAVIITLAVFMEKSTHHYSNNSLRVASTSAQRNSYPQTPNNVVIAYLQSMQLKDFHRAYNYVYDPLIPSYSQQLQEWQYFSKKQQILKKYQIINVTVLSPEQAIVQVQGTLENGEPSKGSLKVQKINGKWKVALSSQTLQQTTQSATPAKNG